MTAPHQPPAPPPLRLDQVDCWIFDLDNTLYPASCNLFAQIDIRMRQFIAQTLKVDLDQAYTLQKRYYRDYGTTLRGLMLAHGLPPDEFLTFVHDIDYHALPPSPELARTLSDLPGRKLIFTNGTEKHAENVLARLGLSDHFDAIFDIRAAQYVPKPNAECYHRLTSRHAVDATRSAMFEDIARNLIPAAEVGMTTVWVHEPRYADWSGDPGAHLPHVHHITDNLTRWLAEIVDARRSAVP
jgi:putative hydrolase of the HAD superfamily